MPGEKSRWRGMVNPPLAMLKHEADLHAESRAKKLTAAQKKRGYTVSKVAMSSAIVVYDDRGRAVLRDVVYYCDVHGPFGQESGPFAFRREAVEFGRESVEELRE